MPGGEWKLLELLLATMAGLMVTETWMLMGSWLGLLEFGFDIEVITGEPDTLSSKEDCLLESWLEREGRTGMDEVLDLIFGLGLDISCGIGFTTATCF